jgi:hypothetical protein
MSVHKLERKMKIKASIDEVFAFFQQPENLAKITPPSLGFKILTPQPIEMKEGALITYTIGVLGMRVGWRTLITSYDPPRRFVDEQIKGPYALWHHQHSFKEVEGGVEMEDCVTYSIPFGIFGEIARKLFVTQQLNDIFDYRTKVISEIFQESKGVKS